MVDKLRKRRKAGTFLHAMDMERVHNFCNENQSNVGRVPQRPTPDWNHIRAELLFRVRQDRKA
jgi:hypothetical protein